MMAARRAYDDKAKDLRRQAILDAADLLFTEVQELPTAAQVARRAGLAKGTIYLYFESREAIFANLLLDGWCRALDELAAKLDANGPGTRAATVVMETFVTLFGSRPILMHLDTMLPEFRRGMSEGAAEVFDTSIDERMMLTGEAVERALGLPPGRGRQLLVRSHAFARGLWQSCQAAKCPASQRTEPVASYADELRASLGEYWRGALVCASA